MANTLLDGVKQRLKIDGSEENDFLTLLIDGAKEHLKNAGVPIPTDGNEGALYKQAIQIHVLLNYENYDTSLNVDKLNKALNSIILQLRW